MNLEKISREELIRFLAMDRTSGKRLAFEFWLTNLKKIISRHHEVDREQMYYVARFSTRFSLVPTSESIFFFPTLTSIARIHDEFVLDQENRWTPESAEIAACQLLLLGGFYLKSALKHYDPGEIRRMGQSFFQTASVGKRKKVIRKMSRNFGIWQNLLCYLEWYLRTERLALEIKKPDEPLIKIVPG